MIPNNSQSSQNDDQNTEELGGKALGLATLGSMGYNVPDYFVISSTENIDDPETAQKIIDRAQAYDRLAVRSSANIEDGAHSSFAGQFESYLNVSADQLLARVRDVRASINADRVATYCKAMDIASEDIRMNVIIQRFTEPSSGGVWMSSGLAGGRLEWTAGRGDAIVGGAVEPNYEAYGADGSKSATNTDSPLVDHEGSSVASKCQEIQAKLGYDVDLEFCIVDDHIQWLQLRRVTRNIGEQTDTCMASQKDVILGEAASPYTAEGTSYRLDLKRGAEWGQGKILVAKATSPADMMFIMAAKGVVTKMGGMLSHSAVVCRELGKACVVGVDIDKIAHDSELRIDGKAGEVHLR